MIALKKSLRVLIFLLGPPGAGKEKRGEGLVEWFMQTFYKVLYRIVMSDELKRAKARNPRVFEEKIGQYIKAQKLVPAEAVISVLDPVIRAATDAGQNILVDGFPRDVDQAEYLKRLADELRGQYRVLVVVVNTPIPVCRRRLVGPGARNRPGETEKSIEGRFTDWLCHGVPAAKSAEDHGVEVHWVSGGDTPKEGTHHILRSIGFMK